MKWWYPLVNAGISVVILLGAVLVLLFVAGLIKYGWSGLWKELHK